MSDTYNSYKQMKKEYKKLKNNLQQGGTLSQDSSCCRAMVNGKMVNVDSNFKVFKNQKEGSCGRIRGCRDISGKNLSRLLKANPSQPLCGYCQAFGKATYENVADSDVWGQRGM